MARAGRPTVEIDLTDQERARLESWTRRHSTAQALAMRARIVLACADGATNVGAAELVGCHQVTAGKWRKRFSEDRLDGLVDAPRPGAPRTIDDDVIEAVVIDTLESAPDDATHWSTRDLAARHGLSKTTVAEIWRAFGLKPWRQDEFKRAAAAAAVASSVRWASSGEASGPSSMSASTCCLARSSLAAT